MIRDNRKSQKLVMNMNTTHQKHNLVKNKRKSFSPVFHLHTTDDDDKYMSKETVKMVKKTGMLNLHGKHLTSVPKKVYTFYESSDTPEVTFDLNNPNKEDDLWWNFKPLTQLDLSSNVLTEIGEQIGIFQDLTVLNLQDNMLINLPKEITELTKLTRLNLNRNKLSDLPEHIDKLRDLRVLTASCNCLENLPDSLVDLVMLEKLDLSNNQLKSLPSGIGYLVRLNELSVSNNKILELPPDIVNMRSLSRFDVNHNDLQNLPQMGELRKLQILHAQHNNIQEIPDFIGCEQLQEIYLGNNLIKDIPDDFFENLQHLKILELRDNVISTLPPNILKLAHITKLDLTNNDLTELPPILALLPHLQTLKVEGNRLKHIRADVVHTGTQRILNFLRSKLTDVVKIEGEFMTPVDACVFPDRYKMRNGNFLNLTMKDLTSIPENVFEEAKEARVTVVDICKNKLSQFPCGLQMLTDYLTELNLSANQLKEVPEEIGCFLKLKFLDLSKNLLSDLPQSMENLTSIRELVLFNNRFSKIPICVFGMAGLEILMLNDNSIQEIDIQGLQKLSRLATLDLSNNSISFVPPELGNMTQIRCLEIKGNSFRQPRYAILEQGTESILSYLRDKIVR